MSISRKRIWRDRLYTARHYYKSPKFALIDLTYALFALFQNPYRTCRKFLEKKKVSPIYAYGETPFTTYAKLVQESGVTSNDTWFEMGAGRGKGCFWLAHFTQVRVVGVEWIPSFVFLANLIRFLFRMPRASFHLGAMEEVDLSEATIIYLYGHTPPLKIPPTAKVITISEPLEGYTVIKKFWVRYPWGRTTAFLQTLNLMAPFSIIERHEAKIRPQCHREKMAKNLERKKDF